ncbi:gp29 [Listeria phage P35]|uniref:Uncharacterized protein n=1 Tax=Listeria phage LP-083-1 TaxID=1458854 RepID=A0A059T6H1_9CAUD|nr:gp29 [Listeria phage P35]AAY53214.1 gp29 [Listeria phage P35]AHL18994.1 hypothetical protein LP083-1_029 [Listeria phage LP-083-1]
MDSFERRAYTVQDYRDEIELLENRLRCRQDTSTTAHMNINIIGNAQVTRINKYDELKDRNSLINIIDFKTLKRRKKEIENAESFLLTEKQALLDFDAETTQLEKDLDNLRNEYETYLDAVYRKESEDYFRL